jgi:alkylation response protein AidB-like acyl-CoA dehydrogenase
VPLDELRELCESLERCLGDPHDAASAMPFARILELDEREHYPHELISVLQRWGLHEFVIPEAQGGRAVDVQDGFNLVRIVARRDPTTATTMMLTSLSFMPVWIAGSDEQRQYFANGMRNGMKLAWGLSERRRGSDILANDTVAEQVEGGYRITGEKWLIGNATVADAVMVFARTDPRGGPSGYSIFAVEKRRLPAGAVEPLAHEPILGLRALDMSGVRLDGCVVPESARIGREGQGLEIALKSSQLARASIASLALGCTDTALRLTLDFAAEREIFGQRVLDIPYSRRQLAECFADVLVADALAFGAVRGLQVAPEQTSIGSSVAKYFVPTLLEGTLSQLAVVMGARHYLRAHPRYGMFQKVMRDFRVANFADGNTVVNLKNVANQLATLLDGALNAPDATRDAAAVRVATLFDLDAQLPPYRPWEQSLSSRGLDDGLLALPHSLRALDALAESAENGDVVARAAVAARRILDDARELEVERARLAAALGRGFGRSDELFELAKRYCVLSAAAACVHLHVHTRDADDGPAASSALLLLCLERLATRLRPLERLTGSADIDAVADLAEHMHGERRLFSFLPVTLASADECPTDALLSTTAERD